MLPHAHNRKVRVHRAGNAPLLVSASDKVDKGQSPILCLVSSAVLLVLLMFPIWLVNFKISNKIECQIKYEM